MIRLLIPAYNEAKNLPALLERIAGVFGSDPYRITVVNDGSSDNTADVLAQLAPRYPLTILTHRPNQGVAVVFRTGFTAIVKEAADDDIVVLMEGDGTSSPELLPELVRHAQQGADVVIASRYQPGGGYLRFPWKRLLLSTGANLTFQILFPIAGVRDYSIFYRAYRVAPLRASMTAHGNRWITVNTFFANIEILLKLRPYIHRIEEVPLRYDYGQKQGKSGMKVWKNLRSYLVFIVRHALRS